MKEGITIRLSHSHLRAHVPSSALLFILVAANCFVCIQLAFVRYFVIMTLICLLHRYLLLQCYTHHLIAILCVFVLCYSMSYVLTRFGRIFLQQILNDEVNQAEYHCRDAKNAECLTAPDLIHQIASKKTAGRHTDSFENCTNQTLCEKSYLVGRLRGYSNSNRTNLKRCGCAMWGDDVRISGHCCVEQGERDTLHELNG